MAEFLQSFTSFQDFTKTGSFFFDEEGGDCFSDHYYIRNEYRKSVKGLATACVFPTNMAHCGLVKELP